MEAKIKQIITLLSEVNFPTQMKLFADITIDVLENYLIKMEMLTEYAHENNVHNYTAEETKDR